MYRIGIWLIALALVFNGAAAYAGNYFSGVPATIAQHHHDAADAVDTHVHSADAVTVGENSGQTHGGMHNHVKCCTICTVVSMLPAVAAVPATFAYKAAVFHTAQHALVGRPVALDPDIPKSIV